MMSVSVSTTRRPHGHRDLIVWQRSVDLTAQVYEVTNGFPAIARYGLSNQLQRAAVSIASNIAEGNRRRGAREYRHFLTIAHGSLAEVDTQLEIAVRIGYTTRATLANILDLIDQIGRMLTKLIQTLHT